MNIAILGLGTVGSGVINLIKENQDKIKRVTGEELRITHAYVNNVQKQRDLDLTDVVVTDDIDLILNSPIDAVIEVMGGIEETRFLLERFLSKGVHVVTANKDMLALHIDDLTALANQHGAHLLYEASVAGGIPIIRSIEQSLNSNQITEVLGILNGTSNYILSKMTFEGWTYQKALTEAQSLGYAEADPTNDIGGFDAQRKIALLARLSYDTTVALDRIHVKGIDQVEVADLKTAQQAGLVLKLLGKSRYDLAAKQLAITVKPVFLPSTHQLANVHNAQNAVFVRGNAVGEVMFYGPGAGSLETASAVVSDVMHLAGSPAGEAKRANFMPFDKAEIIEDTSASSYYLRFEDNSRPDEALLKQLEITLHPLDTTDEQAYVAVTSPMTADELTLLGETVNLIATYPIEGKMWAK